MKTDAPVTVTRLQEMKTRGEKIVMLTAYDYLLTRLLEEAGVDMLLVGDTLGMVFQGEKTTIPVTLEQMIYHTRIVTRAARRAMVISDMPFLSYQASPEEAIRSAGGLIKQGRAQAVKLEGGREMADTIARIVAVGIPVMGHIGFKPQSQHQYGTHIVQGQDEAGAHKLLEDLGTLEQAGVFAVVVEAVPWPVAQEITRRSQVPMIGIGAGPHCDGQVLVTADLLGLFTEFKPKFVKRYAELAQTVSSALTAFVRDVKTGAFPDLEHSYGSRPEAKGQQKQPGHRPPHR